MTIQRLRTRATAASCLAMISTQLASCVPPAAPAATPTSESSGVQVGIVDDTKGFKVEACQRLSSNGTSTTGETSGSCTAGNFWIHKKGDRSSACEVTSTSDWSSADLECEVEAQELDLAFNGMHLAYNVPSNMCSYFWVNPYSYWNHEPGTAPSTLTFQRDRDTGGVIFGSSSVTPAAAGSFDEEKETLSCAYDHTGEDPEGPNCCYGKTAKTVTVLDTKLSKQERFTITLSTVTGIDGTYLTFSTAVRSTGVITAITNDTEDKDYFVWFHDVDAAVQSTAPAGSGTPIQVDYSGATGATPDTTATLAAKTAAAISAAVGAEATVSSATNTVSVTLARAFDATSAAAVTTPAGIGIQVTPGVVLTTTENSKVLFDGKYGNCMSGPAMKTQQLDETYGGPALSIFEVDGVGKNSVYSVDKGIAISSASNVISSNFYSTVDHGGGLPYSLRTWSASPNRVVGITPKEYYEFACLDRSEEVLARIRVKVREWNSSALFLNYKNGTGTASVADLDSTDASNCAGSFAGIDECLDNGGYPINDYLDWKDFGANFPKLKQ